MKKREFGAFIRGLPGKIRGSRLARRLAWGMGGCAIGVLLLWLGLPWVLGWSVEHFGSEALGRPVSVGRVSFNPFKLDARFEKLRIAGVKGQVPLLEIAAADLNLSSASIWHRGLVLDALRVEQPVLRFARVSENRYSFSDILDRLGAQPKAKDDSPLRFSLNNIEFVGGRVEFDDRPVGKTHLVDGLHLGLPFLSNLPARVELFVSPRLEARVDGAGFKLAGQLKPFAGRREASLELRLEALDLKNYLGYLPANLPFRLEHGRLSSNLRLSWMDGGASEPQKLLLAGTLGLDEVSVKDEQGEPLVKFAALDLDIEALEPIASPFKARFARISLTAPELEVIRFKAGGLNLGRLMQTGPEKGKSGPSPQISVARLELNKGLLHWQDQAVAGGFELNLPSISAELQGLDLAGTKPARLEVRAGEAPGESLAFKGEVNPAQGAYAGHLGIGGVKLERLRPYFEAKLGPAIVKAELSAEADLSLQDEQFRLEHLRFGANKLAVLEPKSQKAFLSVDELSLAEARLDLSAREFELGTTKSLGASWALVRDEKGRFDLLEALKPVAPQAPKASGHEEHGADWKLRLAKFECADWGLRFEDRTGSAPVALNLRKLGLSFENWSNEPGQLSRLVFDTQVNKAGTLGLRGSFSTQPLKGELQVDAKAVDLIPAQPYVDQHFRVLLTRGALSGKGELGFDFSDFAQPGLRFDGRLAVDGFSSLDQLNDTDFVQWKHLGLDGLHFQLKPLSINAREVRLEDFYTRLILDAQGRFNLRELASEEGAESTQPAASVSAPVSTTSTMQVKVDKVLFRGGNINYSDRFVKPNYDARLANMRGALLGLSSDAQSIAQLELKGAVDGSAPLTVAGQLNPFRQDRFLDLQAQVKGVDLTSVSTYAAKYVGYGISKGKLSMNVKYQIRDRKLSAQNQIFLDQLTFGERVESPEATKLPVLFAVSLLKNRRGEIDINLPIGGSLDDPEFSVGGIVVKLIFNLIGKAVTAPFALIGSIFGGGDQDELAYIDFPPGRAELDQAGLTKLKALAKALDDRPSLKLEITGQAEQGVDQEGILRARLDESLKSLKARQLVKAGVSVEDMDALKIAPEEYPKLIESVYGAEKIADKPRNILGLAKAIPVADMEKLLLRHFAKEAPDLQSLAALRAKRVSDWLIEEGGVSPERIFLRSALTSGDEIAVAPRVSFSLK